VIRFIRLDMSEPCLRSALRAAWKRQMTLSRSKLRCTHGTALWALTTNAARASIKNDAASWSQTFRPPKDWPKFANHKIQKDPTAYSQLKQRRKIQDALVTAHSAQKTPDNFEAKIGNKVPTKLKLDAMPAPLINEEPILKQYDFVKLENELLVVDPMDSSVVAVIPRKFPKDQATQGSAPSGQTHDPASQGDEAETSKKK